MGRLFGTDGVRGIANKDITADFALKLAQAAAFVLSEEARSRGDRPRAVIGHDPRISSDFISAAVAAGLASSGVDVFDAGVIPTPGAAYLTADLDADFGVMISASHNSAPDNGIKFFSRGGHKLPDATEDKIEAALGSALTPIGSEVGRVTRFADAEDRYLLHLLGTIPHRLDGVKVVLDCANGAASAISPQAFSDAGAKVITIGNDPDGNNINQGCGSTHLSALQAAVVAHGADLGIAHDGDADRCLAVDHTGAIVDGDHIMTVLALALKNSGQLARNTLVTTVMSNLGLKIAMQNAGIGIIDTKVGDRYVLEAMREGGYSLGGEQSGHIIFSQYATTGDGVLTGLHLAAQVAATGKSLRELVAVMPNFPQVLVNVPGVDKSKVDSDPELQALVLQASEELGDRGRVLLRASGTENLVRVMVEASDQGTAQSWADRIALLVERRLAL
ncbi:phosphoglucosamine mutase [Aquiluna sp. KACHI24]|uniref:phosphoglucosamine mutase n=1 Tax=Aquiluna sp. KACHI24 TaxID=2968831 RepID=UPI00220FE36A|nr:phosphoglucosamine mutase [Aquiluna sp. KACHI24]BDP99855.1 phosphoglucosamine mutase [Aquiluna sp. KACHI24]